MKARFIALGLGATLLPLASFGEDENMPWSADSVETGPLSLGGMRVGLGFSRMLGVDAEFSGLGAFNPEGASPLGGGQNYNYDNGFVRLDSTGNAGGRTWNWGYDDAAQYNPAGGGTISYSHSSGLGNGKAGESDDFAPGLEAFAYLQMGQWSGLNLAGGPARVGIKATVHYANISIEHSGTIFAGVSRSTDTFGLGGVVPPLAPYAGTFAGGGPLLLDNPARVTAAGPAASAAGTRLAEVDLFGLTVGPYLELPVTSRFAVSLEGGLSLALADGEYSFRSSTTVPGAGTQTTAGKGSETTLLPGVSAGVVALYQFDDSWSASAGARYQYYSGFEIEAGASEAEFDFGSAFILSLGAAYRF